MSVLAKLRGRPEIPADAGDSTEAENNGQQPVDAPTDGAPLKTEGAAVDQPGVSQQGDTDTRDAASMARNPRSGNGRHRHKTPPAAANYFEVFENDPRLPDPDLLFGRPKPATEPAPFADLSKPEEFDEDAKAIYEASQD